MIKSKDRSCEQSGNWNRIIDNKDIDKAKTDHTNRVDIEWKITKMEGEKEKLADKREM